MYLFIMIDYKKDIEIDKLSISEPQKKQDKWTLQVSYQDTLLTFQTPSLKLNKDDNLLYFDSSKRHSFFKFIDTLEQVIVDYLHLNSERLFKGKVFSKEKLRQSLLASWDVSDEGLVSLKINSNILEKTKFFSSFGDSVSFEQLSENVICIITLEAIIFSKNQFELNYKVSHMRSKRVNNVNESFFDRKNALIEDDKLDFFNE